MKECPGPQRPHFDDPTWYCPRTGSAIDPNACTACESDLSRYLALAADLEMEDDCAPNPEP